ncbi:MAG: winged helix-turn-helix transcriptional regulator [Thermoplasmatota archaeon]
MNLQRPSTRRLLAAFRDGERLASKDLQERTGLARRTIHTVVNELLDAGILRRRHTFSDTRLQLYELAMPYEEIQHALGQR